MQDPKFSLNPLMTIGKQINECFRFHNKVSYKVAKELTLDILQEVKIQEPNKVYNQYAFQLSGGMGQRVMIAMMIACKPKLLIADEATSSLDEKMKYEILELIDNICNVQDMSLLIISHDLPLVVDYCDRIIVMHNGSIVDECHAKDLFNSEHPYTQGLINCLPSISKKGQKIFELNCLDQ